MARILLPFTIGLLIGVPLVGLTGGAAGNDTERFVVGFQELPTNRDRYQGHTVLAVDEDLKYFVVEAHNGAQFEHEAKSDPNVRYADRDLEVAHILLVPNDTHYANYQYDMKPATTNMEAAWDITTGSADVKVCVTDTGLYTGHEDFAGLTVGAFRDFVSGKAAAYDDNGHGTHVTGTIAAGFNNGKGVAGIASGVTILSAKVLNRQGSGTLTQVADGFKWCADQGAHIISASLGIGADYATIRDAVDYADVRGVLIVAAAGNGGPCNNCVEYPAKYDVVVAVSCTDKNNAECGFSSDGPEVDFAAPGSSIASTWPANKSPCRKPDGNHCYVLSSGTSMSTPHVAGLAALVKSNHPAYTKADIYTAMQNTADDLGAAGRDNEFGHGLIQGTAV